MSNGVCTQCVVLRILAYLEVGGYYHYIASPAEILNTF